MNAYRQLLTGALVLLLTACATPEPIPADTSSASPIPALASPSQTATNSSPAVASPTRTVTAPPPEPRQDGLSRDQAATLDSLRMVDGFPLYSMEFHGEYIGLDASESRTADVRGGFKRPAWGCSLFAALGEPENMLYGRNFDWEYSPALLLFTDPFGGYASVSMVDIAYLGYRGASAGSVADLPLRDRASLLDAPYWPFDGMNAAGVAIGMAAVPPGRMQADPSKETSGSLMIMREILDHAGDVDEAVAILREFNIDFEGGPDLHYLIADRSGRSALVEFYQGELVVTWGEVPWHQATNFIRASAGESAVGRCHRYDQISQALGESEGRLDAQAALALLGEVSVVGTQWSTLYDLTSGAVRVVMGRAYDDPHTFYLGNLGP